MDKLELVEMESRAQWRTWLRQHHTQRESIWLVTFKKSSGKPHLPYDDAVEEALCFGWIDSHIRAVDAERSKLLMSPRKRGSPWSALNKRRIAKLERGALLMPAGRARIEQAKRDGSWTLLDDVEKLIEPDDLSAALNRNKRARANFDAFSSSVRKNILWWIKSAKRPETRAKRISETVRLAALNQKANHPS